MSDNFLLFDKKTALEVAKVLVKTGAVHINAKKPFVWASGWLSPIYCDNRKTLSFPNERNIIKKALIDLVKAKFPETEGVVGVATAGIPHASILANELDLPLLYVRSKQKSHGTGQKIEGQLDLNKKYIVLEDLISTGESALQAANSIKNAGATVMGIISIFTYGFPVAQQTFEKADFPLYFLCDYTTLIDYAKEHDPMIQQNMESLNLWKKDPSDWSDNY